MIALIEMFSPDFLFFNALVASLLMGVFCPLIGRHLVFGRTLMLGLALPQISLAGIAFVFLGVGLGWGWCAGLKSDFSRAFLGALIFTIPSLVILALQFGRRAELAEGWLAFFYLLAVASAHLMLSHHAVGENYIEDLFHGRLILIADSALVILTFVLAVCASLSVWARRRILIVLTDRDFSGSLGISVTGWHILIALLNGIVISVAVSVVGPLVTFGFLVLPVMAASLVARSLRSHAVLSSLAGLIMAGTGFWASYQYDLPLGACVVVFGCALLLMARVLSPAGR
jgi:ABC-type Mn2+/Zn2+ transport system permease subunit